ncbi:MAG: hypothetical protein WD739_06865 [Actinomycetota bacterium]
MRDRKGRNWARVRTSILALTLSGLLAAGSAAALAHPGGTDGGARGACSGDATWKLRLHAHERRIGVGYKVQSAGEGELWKVRIKQNRHPIFAGRRLTGEDGSFAVRLVARNTKGIDVFRAAAKNVETGETCRGRAAI